MDLSLKQKVVGVIVAVLALFGVTTSAVKVGSVAQSSEYQATTTAAIWANIPKVIATSTDGVMNIKTLGSVIIGTTDGTIIELKDATSSTDVASTTIAIIAGSPAIGSTLTFDYAIKRGLVINTTAAFSAGRYTITYR